VVFFIHESRSFGTGMWINCT